MDHVRSAEGSSRSLSSSLTTDEKLLSGIRKEALVAALHAVSAHDACVAVAAAFSTRLTYLQSEP